MSISTQTRGRHRFGRRVRLHVVGVVMVVVVTAGMLVLGFTMAMTSVLTRESAPAPRVVSGSLCPGKSGVCEPAPSCATDGPR